RKYGRRIPEKRGDFGAYWEDGAASSARETAMSEQAKSLLGTAETLWSLAKVAGSHVTYPTARADAAWRSILLYDEHTWGASQSVSEPSSRLTRVEWAVKSSFARRALQDARALAAQGLRAYARNLAGGRRRLVVVNTLSWPRSGLAELPANLSRASELLDSSGRPVPLQVMNGRRWLFAHSVPAFGCRVYRIRDRKDAAASEKRTAQTLPGAAWPADSVVENAFYRLRLSHTRGVSSVVDRSSGRELLDPASTYGLGQLIYAAGGANTSLHSPRQPHPRITTVAPPWSLLRIPRDSLVLVPEGPFRQAQIQAGPLFTTITLRSSAPAFHAIVTQIRLWNHQKRIDVTLHLNKVAIYRKEAVYIAFPFRARRPRFRLGMAAAIEDPARDFIPGACHEWYAINNWVACQDGASGIAWCSPDAPLVTLCYVNRGLWPKTADLPNGTIYSYAMNNYWFTNYKAAQGGRMRLRYSFTSSSAPLSNAACERFARSVTAPLMAALTAPPIHTVRRASRGIGRPGQQAGLLTLSGAGVEAAALRPAPEGSGLMMLLRNTSEQPATARIAAAWPGCRFQPVNLVGAPEGPALPTRRLAGRTSASLSLRPYQLRYVKIILPRIPHQR
ncbi:MAG TPA: hypothetical protein VFJ58_02710, partial [Armatimonadota bacterium]|nr:hypothetical protein [Armatimonadota bacterium]